MKHDFAPSKFRKFISNLDKNDLCRVHYCYQLGSTFTLVNLMEDNIINTMTMCDLIKVRSVLKKDTEKWQEMIEKRYILQESTLGNLLKILSSHAILPSDMEYLKWVKEKRDIFIHRFFRNGEWPGDLDEEECQIMIRKLLYLEIIFKRASERIWNIFSRAKLMKMENLGANGFLMMNLSLFSDDTDETKV